MIKRATQYGYTKNKSPGGLLSTPPLAEFGVDGARYSPTTPLACVARPCGRGGSDGAREQPVVRGTY